MSAAVDAPDRAATRPRPDAVLRQVRTVLPLARQESRRLLLHPISLFGWACCLYNIATGLVHHHGARHAHELVDTIVSFYPGVMLILAAHLVASRDHHAGSLEVLAATPLQSHERTLALLLTAVPTAALGLLVVCTAHVGNVRLDRYFRDIGPSPGQLLQGPVTLAGAVLLGVMVARWTSARMAPVVVIVTLVAVNVWLNTSEETLAYFGPLMGWARWGSYAEAWGGLMPGSPGWRVGYLLGLCALAALGALLPSSRRPTRVVASGVVVLLLTGTCGWLMLP